jgi:hypothetical protein
LAASNGYDAAAANVGLLTRAARNTLMINKIGHANHAAGAYNGPINAAYRANQSHLHPRACHGAIAYLYAATEMATSLAISGQARGTNADVVAKLSRATTSEGNLQAAIEAIKQLDPLLAIPFDENYARDYLPDLCDRTEDARFMDRCSDNHVTAARDDELLPHHTIDTDTDHFAVTDQRLAG